MTSLTSLRAAVTTAFTLYGFVFASLFARAPAIKEELDLSEGELGAALLCASLGLLASQPLVGAITARVGSRPVVAVGVCLYGGVLAAPALAPSLGTLAAAFLAYGVGAGTLDVALNAQGVQAEQRHERAIFSSFHAAFSFGAMGGAGVAALAAAAGVDPATHLAIVGAAAIVVGLAAATRMLPAHVDARPDGPRFARPTPAILALALTGFGALLAEGSATDWSAILLAEWRGTSEGVAAAGLAAFSAAMGVSRLAGDPLRERVGAARLLRAGGLVGLVGSVLVVVPLSAPVTIVGFVVLATGIATIFPLALVVAASKPGVPPAPAIAAVSATGYAGLLTGPALIGGLAELLSLPAALCVNIVVCAGIIVLARVGTR